jgi:hypothetical protein
MSDNQSMSNAYRVFFIIGIVFFALGIVGNRGFLAIGITFFIIGLAGMGRRLPKVLPKDESEFSEGDVESISIIGDDDEEHEINTIIESDNE